MVVLGGGAVSYERGIPVKPKPECAEAKCEFEQERLMACTTKQAPSTRNPKPETRNPKPETLHPAPYTLNPTP